MISVAELKQKRNYNLDSALKTIERHILISEGQGSRSVIYHFELNDPVDEIIRNIKQYGYIVRKYEGYDHHNGSWKYIEIYWD